MNVEARRAFLGPFLCRDRTVAVGHRVGLAWAKCWAIKWQLATHALSLYACLQRDRSNSLPWLNWDSTAWHMRKHVQRIAARVLTSMSIFVLSVCQGQVGDRVGRPPRRDNRGEGGGRHHCVGDPLRLLHGRQEHSLALHGRQGALSYLSDGRLPSWATLRVGRPCLRWEAPLCALAGKCWWEAGGLGRPGEIARRCLGSWSLGRDIRPDRGQWRPWAAASVFPAEHLRRSSLRFPRRHEKPGARHYFDATARGLINETVGALVRRAQAHALQE